MMNSIPPAVLGQHSAFLGKTGSGKTSTAKLAVEQIVRNDPGARVCVLDPLKSDWWGLTSSTDGREAGLPFYILGGPRGHVQLHESAGKAIGELVATGALPLSIIDMADFRPGGLQEFFNDFVPALMRKMRGVVYLVIEEAHEFAPKERAGIGAENLAIHHAKKLATAGRSKGIRMMVLTQRTQALHNAVLGSCDTMIAHRLTAPADQEPVKKWLKANVDKATFERVSTSLASLKTGTGWICSGEAQIAELVHFPKISTYDNSATPTGDMAEQHVRTAPVDRDRLRTIIGDAAKQEASEDPVRLRAEIARLTAEASRSAGAASDPAAVAAADQRGYARGFEAGFSEAEGQGLVLWEASRKFAIEHAENIAQQLRQQRFQIVRNPAMAAAASAHSTPTAPPRSPHAPAQRTPSPAASGDGTLSPALQNALNAVAWWHKIGHDPVERARAAVVARLSPKASTFGVYLAELAKRGLVQSPEPGKVSLTDAGHRLAIVPRAGTAAELREMALSLLGPQEQKVFDVVYGAHPRSIARKAVAERMGLSPTASTTGVYLAAVAAYGVIENAGPGEVRAAQWLFATKEHA
ncbi:helicase HerA domain-containing protein [Bradyrhizobium sp. CAR08]